MTLEDALAEVKKNERVCPMPMQWRDLYEILPNKRRRGSGWEPSLPLILAAWHEAPALSKMMRLQEHLEWADSHGCLDEVMAYVQGLSEDQWLHLGEYS